ncbi:hypothetical protein PR048_010664 [Dryococelus australis]|uniref:Uncharacterized protein n=1 Tax=Dryococelus australis TaxID=614101 RepID=A0ABQ9I3B1_9NEOP|nr:hypothetical protein PR048_010664 [Dryococelus australis]
MPTFIVACFVQRENNHQFMQKHKAKWELHTKELGYTEEEKQIFVNDNLTAYNEKLLAQAMAMRKQGKLEAAWTNRGGNICKEDSRIQTNSSYTSYFSCRDFCNGDGVAIYVRNCFTQSLLSCHNNGCYSLWVEISNIGGYYRPPQYKLQDFLFALDHDLANCKKVDTFILGDFNISMCEQNNECTNDRCAVLTTICHSSYGEKPQKNQECIVINDIKVANVLKIKLGNLTVENKDTNSNKHLEYILGNALNEATETKKLHKHNKILCSWASPRYMQLILIKDKLYKKYKKKRNNSNIKLELN